MQLLALRHHWDCALIYSNHVPIVWSEISHHVIPPQNIIDCKPGSSIHKNFCLRRALDSSKLNLLLYVINVLTRTRLTPCPYESSLKHVDQVTSSPLAAVAQPTQGQGQGQQIPQILRGTSAFNQVLCADAHGQPNFLASQPLQVINYRKLWDNRLTCSALMIAAL